SGGFNARRGDRLGRVEDLAEEVVIPHDPRRDEDVERGCAVVLADVLEGQPQQGNVPQDRHLEDRVAGGLEGETAHDDRRVRWNSYAARLDAVLEARRRDPRRRGFADEGGERGGKLEPDVAALTDMGGNRQLGT